jgi:hypothetical protein
VAQASATPSSHGSARPVYRERLGVPWWAWPVALAVSAFLATELAIGAFALRSVWTYAVAAALAVAAMVALGRITVSVDAATLRVDDAQLPLSVIGEVTVVDAAARRDLLGQDADPIAFVILRPWISGGVRIDLADPQDPTPYWFVSSRRPAELAAALTKAADVS